MGAAREFTCTVIRVWIHVHSKIPVRATWVKLSLLDIFVDLKDTTLALDFRVTVLEENGGDDGNSSVAELEVRVETLEGTSDDQEMRLTAAENDIEGKLLW